MSIRRLVRAGVLSLIVGAMATVLIAWRCAAYSARGPWSAVDMGEWVAPAGEGWGDRALISTRSSFGVRETEAWGSGVSPVDGAPGTLRQYSMEAGWPVATLQRRVSRIESRAAAAADTPVHAVYEQAPTTWPEGFDAGSLGRRLAVPPRRWLPVVPMWPGFLLSTLVLGGVAWGCGRAVAGARRRFLPLWAIWRGRDDGEAAWRSWEDRIRSGARMPRGHALALVWLMRGRRRARRRWWPVAALLGAGLGATVATAWACAALSVAPRVTAANRAGSWAFQHEESIRWEWKQSHEDGVVHRGFGLEAVQLTGTADGWAFQTTRGGRYYVQNWRGHAGWPWHALAWESAVEPELNFAPTPAAERIEEPISWRGGLLVWRPEADTPRAPVPRRFPFMPLWTGLLLDTLVWSAAAAALVFPLSLLIRARRIARAACPACGYEVGVSPLCTECGASISRGRASPATAGTPA